MTADLTGLRLTEGQRAVLEKWRDGAGSPWIIGIRSSARLPHVAQCVRKGLLATQSTLPFAGHRRRMMVLYLTAAGRRALSAESPAGKEERG